jgi:protein-S-isoprenylcysteine O-methyltransferase Ste14
LSRLENRIPPPLVAAAFALVMWAVAGGLPGASVQFPGQAVATAALVVAGLSVIAISILQFNRARTTINPLKPDAASALVTGGVFQLTRNPMYLGMALVLAGWAVWLGNAACVLLLALFVAYITRFQIAPEERALRAHFSEEFDAYAQQVRRWI